jgi:serpin B
MKTKIVLFALISAIVLSSCSKTNKDPITEPANIELTAKAREVIDGNNNFGIQLFNGVAQSESDNLMLSPLSASVALTMLLNGCDGETFTQLKQMLGYPADLTIEEVNAAYNSLVSQLLTVDPKVTIALANAIFYRQGFPFKQPFLNTIAQNYDALVKSLNFALPSAIQEINKWASDNTNGKIPQVIDSIDPATVMFLMNALYFKGDWTYQFKTSETQNLPFTLQNGTVVNVPTMKGDFQVKAKFEPEYQTVELPYGRTNFSMVIIVPNGSLAEFYATFTPAVWSNITSHFDTNTQGSKTMVYLPKFEFEYEKQLKPQLQSLGMVDAFEPSLANLSGISDEDIFVSFVKQNTFVKVDEKGTEAAAVTTIGIDVVSMPPSFQANKPFVFAIRERTTNTLLFVGQVTDPRS